LEEPETRDLNAKDIRHIELLTEEEEGLDYKGEEILSLFNKVNQPLRKGSREQPTASGNHKKVMPPFSSNQIGTKHNSIEESCKTLSMNQSQARSSNYST